MVDRAERSSSTGTVAAERVADVLLAFSRADGALGVSMLARELSLSKAVTHRILQSLVSRGFVRFDAGARAYRLGPSAAAIGAHALRQLDLRALAHDDLVALRDRTGETTTLSILAVDRRAYIEQVESEQSIRMTVELGRLHPLHAGASSRAILAFLPEADANRIIDAGLAPLTDATIRDADALRDCLADVRDCGIATSRGERQSGAGSVAAPLFGFDQRVVGSISVCGPLARFDESTIAEFRPIVTATARRISERMRDSGSLPVPNLAS